MKVEAKPYPKRLIEVDLPIRRISEHARREKSIRHGHISTLHIWWARRPLAACRAVICASLWPDPADPNCPVHFRDAAKKEMLEWANHERLQMLSRESQERFNAARKKPELFADPLELRRALLDFIADFANWDNSTNSEFLVSSRLLTRVAHEALGGISGTRPLVVDPFAGGGSIPLEASRIGADAYASDLNPIPVLLNKVVLGYMPKFGKQLAEQVRKWGDWMINESARQLASFYPKDPDGSTPVAYLWARKITCEGPGCGAEIPMMRSLWLAKKKNRSVALQIAADKKSHIVGFRIIAKTSDGWFDQDTGQKVVNPSLDGTVKTGAVTCPCCGYTTPNPRVRLQLASDNGGAASAKLVAVAVLKDRESGRFYRLANSSDVKAASEAAKKLQSLLSSSKEDIGLIPSEEIPRERPSPNARGLSAVTRMGAARFSDLFTPRQLLALVTMTSLVAKAGTDLPDQEQRAVRTILGLCIGKMADLANSCCRWEPVAECPRQLFARQAVPIVWDFPEGVPIGESSGSMGLMIDRFVQLVETSGWDWASADPQLASATSHPLPDDVAEAVVTDPPYYDSVPYGDLSDFFYVWLRRALHREHPELFQTPTVGKDEEAIWNPGRIYSKTGKPKDESFYESQMLNALAEARRFTKPSGIGVVVFAHKSTAGWEAILSALINAGWTATASWPVDTEMGSRVNAMGTASLASSVHIICRPRESPDGSLHTDLVGDWSEVLKELPQRLHDWMPRLAEEGVVGADAIFACLGPALEIFSRYTRVEKASGDVVALKEYLEHVWAAVSKEALSVIFEGASTEGFEPDARLTAMWLWTIAGSASSEATDTTDEDAEDTETVAKKAKKTGGFSLEYDAARKIAQGLGAHLEDLRHLVETAGDTVRLLPVSERTAHLFGKLQAEEQTNRRKTKKKDHQLDLFAELADEKATEETWTEKTVSKFGETTLDRVHQSMILFAANRGEALKRFLVEDGAGKDPKFWRLAQALSALYPSQTDEKRWVDGVLARKKGLGL